MKRTTLWILLLSVAVAGQDERELAGPGRPEMVSVFMGPDSATKMEISVYCPARRKEP